MKKILLFSAILVGTMAASQAAVHVDIGINLPFPRPERVIISRPAPVYVERAPVCAPPVVVVRQAPPVCHVPAPVVVVPSGYYYQRATLHHGQHHRHGHRALNHHSRNNHRWDHSHSSHGHRR